MGAKMQVVAVVFAIILLNGMLCSNVKFEREMLDEHNKHRATHNAKTLTLDEELSKNATLSAKKAAESGSFDSISPGQSVLVSCATFKREVTGKEVSDAWYGEVCDDNFEFKNPDNEKARGFTQLVWKDTSRIGVGKATGRGKNGEICIYIVGVYRPPGNLVGFFGENVEKGTFDKDEYCKLGEDEYDEKENEGSSANDSSHEKEKPDEEEEEEEEEEEKGEEENNEDQNVAVAVKDKTEKVHKNANKKNLKNANKKNKS